MESSSSSTNTPVIPTIRQLSLNKNDENESGTVVVNYYFDENKNLYVDSEFLRNLLKNEMSNLYFSKPSKFKAAFTMGLGIRDGLKFDFVAFDSIMDKVPALKFLLSPVQPYAASNLKELYQL